jgi:nitrogen-specific signal transduction histidine kinase
VEQALRLNARALAQQQIQVIRDNSEVPPVEVEKHKVLQILVNVIRNARQALDQNERTDRRIILRVGANGNHRARPSSCSTT